MTGQVTNPRRRVRTGCLTCRGRRRKCGEERPECANCKSKGLNCRYGVNITFVTPKGQKLIQQQSAQRPSTSNSNSITYDAPPASDVLNRASSHNTGQSSAASPQTAALQEIDSRIQIDDDLDSLPEETSIRNDEVDIQNTLEWHLDGHNSSMHEPVQPSTESQLVSFKSQAPQLSPWHDGHTAQGMTRSTQEAVGEAQAQYELELLHHYRYRVATILDLELGNLYFGIHVLLDAKRLTCVHKSILALSSFHRAVTDSVRHDLDRRTSAQNASEAYAVNCTNSPGDALTRSILTAVTVLMAEDPLLWIEKLHHIFSQIPGNTINHESRPLMARLVLTAVTMASSRRNLSLIHWFLDDPLTAFGMIDANHPQHELQTSLTILAESSHFLPGVTRHGKQLLDAWQSCWKRLGLWYSGRTVKMQEILHLSDANDASSQNGRVFPFILFSNNCAVVANVAYHLAAILLLQNKPRLVKPATRYGSSTSSILHTQNLIGIAGTAADTGFWDPVMAVAIFVAAKRLSHYEQRYAAAEVLRKITKVSGMNLKAQIDEIVSSEAV